MPMFTSISTLHSQGLNQGPARDSSSRPAYIIYTSGTTGTPKGVTIGSAAFAAALRATVNALGIDRETRTLCVSPFHFDGSFGTLFATLFAGGTVFIRSRDELLFPRAFFNTVKRERITYTGFSPSYLRILLASPQVKELSDTTLDVIALGGEATAVADLRALWNVAPEVNVFNRYGPTETTIAVTHIRLSREIVEAGIIPIGRPHPGVSFYLLDDKGSLITDRNVIGELHIGGSQLMEGYWGDPSLSAQVLRDDVVSGEKIYRTGDLVFRDANDDYVYVDRVDRLVKRGGVRISLIEVADAIRRLPRVTAAACVLFDDEGAAGIVAFVVVKGDMEAIEVMRGLRGQLPDSMLPSRVEFVGELPMTASSKLDERGLLDKVGLLPRSRLVGPEEAP
jgi:acyl-coenzyme A synthetase/AMP-(fatty) acid ligase